MGLAWSECIWGRNEWMEAVFETELTGHRMESPSLFLSHPPYLGWGVEGNTLGPIDTQEKVIELMKLESRDMRMEEKGW